MKKSLSFTILSLVILLSVFSFVPKSVLADGVVMLKLDYLWDYSDESNQQAFINYDNGIEKMIISVGLEGENNNSAVWLFPVPSNPNQVVIDVLKSLPQLSGEKISTKANLNAVKIITFLQMTQIYTIPYILSYGPLGLSIVDAWRPSTFGTPAGIDKSIESDVVVYQHLEKEGLTSEIITAKTATGLYNYLRGKGLEVESGSIPVLDNYIGKEYSFVASWISSSENIISGQRGVLVTFPTKNIYFPMLPTSVYGSKIIPVTIKIIGHVSPKIFQDIKSYTKINYYINSYVSFTDNLKNFYNGQNQNVKYTKIEINAPSNFFTEDLWIDRRTPLKTYYLTFIVEHSIVTAIILLILSSIMAGLLAGMIVFRDLRKNPVKLSLIGLSNCLTLIGLLITTVIVSTKEEDKSKIKIFVSLFSVLFLIISALLVELLLVKFTV